MVTSHKLRKTRPADLKPAWHVIDADGRTLGRLASEIAILLQGKHKPVYVSNMTSGDFVVVINAEKVRVTGKKREKKIYYRHSGYHGGLKERTLAQVLDRTPTRVIGHAVKGMLPKSTLGRRMLSRLKLYAGPSHPHQAQTNVRVKTKDQEQAPVAAQEQEEPPAKRPRAKAPSRAKATTAATESPTATQADGSADAKDSTADATEAASSSAGAESAEALDSTPTAEPAKPATRRKRASRDKTASSAASTDDSKEVPGEQAEPAASSETEED